MDIQPFKTRTRRKLERENNRLQRRTDRGLVTKRQPFDVEQEYGDIFAPTPKSDVSSFNTGEQQAPAPQAPANRPTQGPSQQPSNSLETQGNDKVSKILALAQTLGEDPDPQIMNMVMSAYLDAIMETPPSRADDLASAFQLTGDPYIGQEFTNSLYGELGIDPGQIDAQNALMEQFKADFPVSGTGEGALNSEYLQKAAGNSAIPSEYYKDLSQDREDNNFLQNWFNNPNSEKNRQARIQEILSRYEQEPQP